jgi:hypothetical protein
MIKFVGSNDPAISIRRSGEPEMTKDPDTFCNAVGQLMHTFIDQSHNEDGSLTSDEEKIEFIAQIMSND